jgi:hypothetical protein
MSRALVRSLAAGFALALSACGGEDRGRPQTESLAAPPLDLCAADDDYQLTPITTFDSDAASGVVACSDGGISCDFYFNYDTVHSPARADGALLEGSDCMLEIHEGETVVAPNVGARLVNAQTTRCGEPQAAFNFVAENLAMCKGSNGRRGWGGAQEIDFKDRPGGNPLPVDASAYDGVSFWVKQGDADVCGENGKTWPCVDRSIIVLAVDLHTAGQRDIVDPISGEAASCDGGEPLIAERPDSDYQKCDPFAVGVTLEDEWTFIAVRFDEMQQKGFGMYSPEGLHTNELLRLQFLVTAGDWDFWLDDVSFFQDPE